MTFPNSNIRDCKYYTLLEFADAMKFATLMLIKPAINITLEIKRFLVCLQCVIWMLLFPVTLNGANMFVALSLKLLYVHIKFYTVSVAIMVGFCSKHMLLTLDHCLDITQ